MEVALAQGGAFSGSEPGPSEELAKLEYLALVSKVCTELDNHLGINDKDLAEFVISLAEKNTTVETFKASLVTSGAEFSDSLVSNLLRLIRSMSPPGKAIHEQRSRGEGPKREGEAEGAVPGAAAAGQPRPCRCLCPLGDRAGGRRREGRPGRPERAGGPDAQWLCGALGHAEEAKAGPGPGPGQGVRPYQTLRGADCSEAHPGIPAVPPKCETVGLTKRSEELTAAKNTREGTHRTSWKSHKGPRQTARQRQGPQVQTPVLLLAVLFPDPGEEEREVQTAVQEQEPEPCQRQEGPLGQGLGKEPAQVVGQARGPSPPPPPKEPAISHIYTDKVTSILQFGCFVQLEGLRKWWEGLVYISELRREAHVADVADVVSKSQWVKVKVLSFSGTKTSPSMKDVDQESGEDLDPNRWWWWRQWQGWRSNLVRGTSKEETSMRNLDRPSHLWPIRGPEVEDHWLEHKSLTRCNLDPEKWKRKQMIAASILSREKFPDFDEEMGILPQLDGKEEEDLEIELVEKEPPFLRGHMKWGTQMSPVRMVRNPESSLLQAAMMQSGLAKEQRELKQVQQREDAKMDSIPTGLDKHWFDPLPDAQGRQTATNLRAIRAMARHIPEWKKQAFGDNKVFYGKKTQLSLVEQREGLPIYRLKGQLVQAFRDNQILVVTGETGCRKTTQITQYLAEAGYKCRGKIGCTQPRRMATMSVAKRVSEEFGCRLSQEVGYTIRFEDCSSPETSIKYTTDGMLLCECLVDPDLTQYAIIMLDKAHERTIHTNVLFGLLKKAVQKQRDMKLIITSATLDALKFSQYFCKAPIFIIPGRTYPMETLYAKEPETDYLDASLLIAMHIHLTEPPGNILVFLTGQEEIDTAWEMLYERMKSLGPDVPELIILPMYSALPSKMQTRIFELAPPGSRKVVIATNIAETSLTIDSIYYVVDPGFVKQKVYISKTDMDQLVVTPISQAQALGIHDLLSFNFMDSPPVETLLEAMEQLYTLGFLDDQGLLTCLGRRMAQFPLEPMLCKMLIMSAHLGCSEEVLTTVSMLSMQNIFYRPKDKQALTNQKKAKFRQIQGNHLTLLAVYNSWKDNQFSQPWCYDNFLPARSLHRAQDICKQMLGIMERHKLDVVSCGKATVVYIHPSGTLFNRQPEWVVYHELVLTTKECMREVTTVDPRWLVEFAPTSFKLSDPDKLSQLKKQQCLGPLYNGHKEQDAWSISRALRQRQQR
ncbi:ATP-dependent RNA helicase DHX8 [Heterocephalus glaber]|uniref:ATP-dependent RNA helicase DHX8 n=1 Tax=Heterocephalus glaber TaxID=10181 RepID=G5AKM7_HETGA|nr:ATP-dependent RNA helicase DHX8 [Heterocephalus glaber]